MKAILIVDKPIACWECMLCGRGVKERFCIARIYETGNSYDCDIKDLNKVESWCPLKPMPQKKYDGKEWTKHYDVAGDYLKAQGYNQCLDEILGETE